MKKFISVLTVIMLTMTMLSVTVFAAEDKAVVYVTITDDKGLIPVAYESVQVSDFDKDGMLTINDTLIGAHKAFYKDGESGYETMMGDYGLFITKLWGVENGGSYGYYHNNKMGMSLTEEVRSGDSLNAYVFVDIEGFSDTYCFFDKAQLSADKDSIVTLTLKKVTFDENYMPIDVPCANAEILLNGEKTGIKTNENGEAAIKLSKSGNVIISAVSENETLVPPVCKADVKETGVTVPVDDTTQNSQVTENNEVTKEDKTEYKDEIPNTSVQGETRVAALLSAAVLMGVALYTVNRKRNEKAR